MDTGDAYPIEWQDSQDTAGNETYTWEYFYEVNATYNTSNDYMLYTGDPKCRILLCGMKNVRYMITSVGILLNLVFLFTVTQVPKQRSSITNYYLVNLSIVDTMFLITHIVVLKMKDSLVLLVVSKIQFRTLLAVASLTIMVVCIERLIGIIMPFTYRQISSNSRTTKLLIAIWFFGILFCAPKSYTEICLLVGGNHWEKWWWLPSQYIALIPVLASLLVVTVLYSILIFKLSCHSKMSDAFQEIHCTSRVDRVQVARMLVISAAVFFICITPTLVGLTSFITGLHIPSQYSVISGLLLLINSGINPVIYNVASAKYRRGLVSAFTFRPPVCRTQTTLANGMRGNQPWNEVCAYSHQPPGMGHAVCRVTVQIENDQNGIIPV